MIESRRKDDHARSMAVSAGLTALAVFLTDLVVIVAARHEGGGRPLVLAMLLAVASLPPALIWFASTLLRPGTTLRGAIGGLWLIYALLMVLVAWFSFLGFWLIPNSLPHED